MPFREIVDAAERELGGLDGLVCNVGIGAGMGLGGTTVEHWDHVFAVNTRAHFLLGEHYRRRGDEARALRHYEAVLGRDVDPTGLAGWTQALSSGVSAGRLATLVALSEEYATTAVRRAYLDVLRREPEAGGLRNWVNAVMGGMLRPEDLRGALIASEEYYLVAGSTPVGYVTQLYRDLLRRDPQPAEVESWVAELSSRGRGVVSRGVWASLESSRLRVDEAYRLFLGRSADPTGLSGWAPVLQADGENALRTVIVDSDEYRSRSLTRF